MTLTIGRQSYTLRPINGHAFALAREGGEEHHVELTPHGAHCSCGDYIFRREWADPRGCKHIRALAGLDLIPEA